MQKKAVKHLLSVDFKCFNAHPQYVKPGIQHEIIIESILSYQNDLQKNLVINQLQIVALCFGTLYFLN